VHSRRGEQTPQTGQRHTHQCANVTWRNFIRWLISRRRPESASRTGRHPPTVTLSSGMTPERCFKNLV
jgi:hypothetical protein